VTDCRRLDRGRRSRPGRWEVRFTRERAVDAFVEGAPHRALAVHRTSRIAATQRTEIGSSWPACSPDLLPWSRLPRQIRVVADLVQELRQDFRVQVIGPGGAVHRSLRRRTRPASRQNAVRRVRRLPRSRAVRGAVPEMVEARRCRDTAGPSERVESCASPRPRGSDLPRDRRATAPQKVEFSGGSRLLLCRVEREGQRDVARRCGDLPP
jgi:hypothetical protein